MFELFQKGYIDDHLDRWSQWSRKIMCGRRTAKVFKNENAEYIESDLYWMKWMGENPAKTLAGMFPYHNKYFLKEFRNDLEVQIHLEKMLIVSMSLVDKLCKAELLDYFEARQIPMMHVILEASKDTIKLRIKNDDIRNPEIQRQQMEKVGWQVEYLNKNYLEAIRVSTENKNIEEIVDEIKNSIEKMS